MRIRDLSFGDALRDAISQNLETFAPRMAAEPGHAAAVAFTLVEADDQAVFLLTQRAMHLRNHPGQFALPGGRIDPGESAETAALRELEEEVGIALPPESVLGRLDDFVTRSGFAITPVIVWAEDAAVSPNPAEVHAVFRIPISDLDRDDGPHLTRIPQSDRPVLSMPLLGDFVHAPTAVFLYQFREVALRGQPTRVDHFEQPLFAWR